MPVCSYYLRGACKYGDRCRNEHPGAPGNFGNQTWTTNSSRLAVPYTVETMTADFTPLKDKPLWPLSSYGPAKYEGVIVGGLDESPEELRLKAVTAVKGTTDEYTKYEGEKTSAADQVYANARSNVRQLYDQALKASTQAQASTALTTAPALATSTPSPFGVSSAPSMFGRTTTATFGTPAFGQPAFSQTGFSGSASSAPAFGQGAPGASTFTQPTLTPSPFGQTSSAFGQPSAFGSTTQPTSGFSQPSTQPTSAFGKPSQPTSVFGQPSQPMSVFGQPTQPTSAFSQPTQSTRFDQPSQLAFGQSSLIKPASGGFGGVGVGGGGGGFASFASQPSAFSSTATPSGSTTTTMSAQSAFGPTSPVHSAFGTASSATKSAFATSPTVPFGISPFSSTPSAPAIQQSTSGGVSPFVSSPMTVTPSSEQPASGAPDFASAKAMARMKPAADRYLDLLPNNYSEMIPSEIKAAFMSARFEWGKIPDWIPPADVR